MGGQLTEWERDQVAQEAICIMRSLEVVVMEISGDIDEGNDEKEDVGATRIAPFKPEEVISMRCLLLKHILPMGLVELMLGLSQAIGLGVAHTFNGLGPLERRSKGER